MTKKEKPTEEKVIASGSLLDLLTQIAIASQGRLTSEQLDELVGELKKNIPAEVIESEKRKMRAGLAGAECSLEGYYDFYYALFEREIPRHAREWATNLWRAYKEENGEMIKASRGFTKSTIGSSFALYLLGHNPSRSVMIVQGRESDAKMTAAFMAGVIETSAAWKLVFPHVVPDTDRGWSLEGYNIKNTQVEYPQWVDKVFQDHRADPSLLAVSVTSGSVGKHPTLLLLIDDIHDYKNTSSRAERETTVKTVLADIMPVMSQPKPRPFVGWFYTPWDEEDTYAYVERTGMFHVTVTPAFVEDVNGTEEWEGRPVRLTWPEVMGIEELKKWRSLVGMGEFARMFLVDLVRAKNVIFKYYVYPHEHIDPRWLRGGGVDYASVITPTRTHQGGRSYFAEAVGTKTPQNTIVLVDGFVGQITQAEGEAHVASTQKAALNWRTTALETNGKGEEFYALIKRNGSTRVLPHPVGSMHKSDRLYRHLSPLLENGLLLISDADTLFLNAARRFFDRFPNIADGDMEWDVADSIYHMVSVFPECAVLVEGERNDQGIVVTSSQLHREKTRKAFAFGELK